jgi:hypothetical protein
MSCPCKNTHGKTLACERCLEGHIGYAAVLAREVAEDPARAVERRLALGNLKAAEWHACALGRPDVAAQIREARHKFAEGDADAVVALLALEISTVKDVKSVKAENGENQNPVHDFHDFHGEEEKGGEF